MRICDGLEFIEKSTHVRLEADGPGQVVGLFEPDVEVLRDALTAWLERPAPIIDEQVAREVMGWTGAIAGADSPPVWLTTEFQELPQNAYTPSTDAGQALTAYLHALDGDTRVHVVYVHSCRVTSRDGTIGTGDTLAEALCNAALHVVRNRAR